MNPEQYFPWALYDGNYNSYIFLKLVKKYYRNEDENETFFCKASII